MNRIDRVLACSVAVFWLACSPEPAIERVLYQNALDSPDAALTRTGTHVDREIFHDGEGSMRIDADQPVTVRIAEIEPDDAENVRLIYRAALRSKELTGRAYLEMWCAIPARGEFFSRALHDPLSGTTDWVTQETPFFLDKGQRASRVKLNLVIEGTGTVWVDDVMLALARR